MNETMKTDRMCIACGSHAISAFGTTSLFKCDACGTLLVEDYDQHLSENSLSFENDYIHAGNRWLFEDYREPALKNISALLKRHDTGWRKFLDIGSATGHLFRYYKFSEMGKVTAVEPSRYGCELIRKAYPFVEVKEGDIDAIPLEHEGYDVVTIFDTLYFHPSPAALLKRVREALIPGGLLICEVANYRWLDLIGRVSSRGTLWRAYYSREAIRDVIRLNGFDIVEVSHNIGNVPQGLKGVVNRLAYFMTRTLYVLSGGKWDWLPKIIIVAKKSGKEMSVHDD